MRLTPDLEDALEIFLDANRELAKKDLLGKTEFVEERLYSLDADAL